MAEEKTEKRSAVSKRMVLDESGTEQKDWLGAGGIAYKCISEDFTATVMFNELPQEIRDAYTAFGMLTHAGNLTNTVRNGEKSRFSSEQEALEAWLEDLKAGNWTGSKGETEAGPTLLLQAIVRVKEAADGTKRTDEQIKAIRDWLEAVEIDEGENRKKAAKERRAKVRATKGVAEAILDIQREKLAKKTAGETRDVTEIPG